MPVPNPPGRARSVEEHFQQRPEPPSPRFSSFSRLSTGTKMLVILTVALLPLGLIALFASIQSAANKHAQREIDARIIATAEARQIDVLILRGSNTLRGLLALPGLDRSRCEILLRRNAAAFPKLIRLALIDRGGRVRCATPGFAEAGLIQPRSNMSVTIRLLDHPGRLLFASAGPDGSFGVGVLPLDLLRRLMPSDGGPQTITLRQDAVGIPLASAANGKRFDRRVSVRAPIAAGQAMLDLTIVMNALSAVEVLLVLLPLLMWAAAAAIGWIVVNHLLLKPLGQLQRAVAAYRPGQGALDLPPIATPAHEIGALAKAFAETTGQLAQREAALEEGLNHQVRLTREVHHRVKNNLQVVASLINLHSRGTEGEVAAAYASIQRRVDALAVVHRNHFAELEENRGVALRALIAELTGNLRATAPPSASHLTITLDMVPASITQDVAVPIAFLVTEMVELVMACDPTGNVAITLVPAPEPNRALLAVEAPGLSSALCHDHPGRERFQRIITGLSRQLRAQLQVDEATGRHAIMIAILPNPDK